MPVVDLPDVVLRATSGDEVRLRSLSGWIVLFCYPWTGRPGLPNPPNWDSIQGAHGSTPQAEGYRDQYSEFCDRQVRVFGLSLQDPAYQAEFARRAGLPFTLLSDENGRFSQSLSLDMFATGGVDYLKRVTLIVRDGPIVCRREDIEDPSRDAAEVLQWLDQQIRRSDRRFQLQSDA